MRDKRNNVVPSVYDTHNNFEEVLIKDKSHRINVYRLNDETSFDEIDLTGGGYDLEYSNDQIKFYCDREGQNGHGQRYFC